MQDLDNGSDDLSTDILAAPDVYFISATIPFRSVRKQYRLIKTDTTGLILWQKNYGISVNDFIVGMRYTASGNILLAGQSSPLPSGEQKLRLLLVNQQGDSLKNLLYSYPQPLGPNGNLRANGALEDRVLALRDGGFTMLAELDTTGNTYSLMVKVNSQLQPQWQYTFRAPPLFGAKRRMFFAGACELSDNSILILATNQLPSGHNNPFYLLRLDGQTGQLRNTYQLLSTICAKFSATKLLPDGDSAVFALGTCLSGGQRDGTYAAHISLKGLPSVVLAASTPQQPAAAQPELNTLYPNPADDAVTLTYRCPPGLAGPGTLRLRDALGREVQHTAVAASATGSLTLPLGTQVSGLYLCELSWPNQVPVVRKLLVRH